MKYFRYCAHAMAALMDLGMGALIVALCAHMFGVDAPFWFLAVGAVMAVLPDMDLAIPILLGRRLEGDHHQTIMHRPVVVLPMVTLLAYFLGGIFWAVAGFLCVFWHYIHDSKELGSGLGGIAWLWPLSTRYWNFTSSERPEDSRMGKVPDYHLWWVQPGAMSIREPSIAAVALVIATALTGYLLVGLALATLQWAAIALVWLAWKKYPPT